MGASKSKHENVFNGPIENMQSSIKKITADISKQEKLLEEGTLKMEKLHKKQIGFQKRLVKKKRDLKSVQNGVAGLSAGRNQHRIQNGTLTQKVK